MFVVYGAFVVSLDVAVIEVERLDLESSGAGRETDVEVVGPSTTASDRRMPRCRKSWISP